MDKRPLTQTQEFHGCNSCGRPMATDEQTFCGGCEAVPEHCTCKPVTNPVTGLYYTEESYERALDWED